MTMAPFTQQQPMRNSHVPSLLIFDLDDTLVDWSQRSQRAREAVAELLAQRTSFTTRSWLEALSEPDGGLWEQVITGALPHEELAASRMKRLLAQRECERPGLVEEACARYHEVMVEHARVDEAVLQLLAALKQRYTVHLLTNGLAEFQWLTLRGLQLEAYFDQIFICSDLRCYKPDTAPFRESLRVANCTAEQSWMIGDSWADDVIPALELGMVAVWVNPEQREVPDNAQPHFVVESVLALQDLLCQEEEEATCER